MKQLAISISEASKVCGVSKTLLYALVSRGRGPRTIRVGHRRLIRVAELERWLLEREEQPAA